MIAELEVYTTSLMLIQFTFDSTLFTSVLSQHVVSVAVSNVAR